MGENRLKGYEQFYRFGHVPLDNIIHEKFQSYKPPPPPLLPSWSRLKTYKEYMDYQQWIRQTFVGSFPISVEFFLWQDHDPSS
jgi:hypothetical protein